jgi:photosystem II stability/assembly factor-like uncharacterized protein
MLRTILLSAFVLATTSLANAQWEIQSAPTTASLRGIHALGNGIAWSSGSSGTVLRTTDDGAHWQLCATPADAEKLDFRGIQAFDQNTAIVMSSGKGDLSRLYKTTDACKSWKLVFTNPDKEGFWDAIVDIPDQSPSSHAGYILGDPINGVFQYLSKPENGEEHRLRLVEPGGHLGGTASMPAALPGESSFAASNSVLIELPRPHGFAFATGGSIPKPRVISSFCYLTGDYVECQTKTTSVPMAAGPSAGIFSLAYRTVVEGCPTQAEIEEFGRTNKNMLIPGPHCESRFILVAVGGDYAQPESKIGTAAYTQESIKTFRERGDSWQPAQTPPHGYRSSVAYDSKTKTWITVGPNGTDISRDDGRNWTALKPTAQDAPDADKNWNALSLPFVVGPHGRIGKLNAKTLAP